jgi:hypothetical protein
MRIPRTININGIPYEVVFDKKLLVSDHLYGKADQCLQQIILSGDLTPEREAKTFVHEILHAIFFETGISGWLERRDANLEEDICNVVAPILYEVIRQLERNK